MAPNPGSRHLSLQAGGKQRLLRECESQVRVRAGFLTKPGPAEPRAPQQPFPSPGGQ